MITVEKLTKDDSTTYNEYRGVAADLKPVDATNGDVYVELDTAKRWQFGANGWDRMEFPEIDISGKENSSNKVKTVTASSTHTQYPSAKCLYNVAATKEDSSNKVTELTAESTNDQYPSAKCVYDLIANLTAQLAALTNAE